MFGGIAERLSIRLIIMQAWWALVGPWSEVVVVCLCVTGLRLHSLRSFSARATHGRLENESKDIETVNCSTMG